MKETARTNSLILASKAQNLADAYPVRSILLASQAIQTARGEEKGALLNVEAENVLRRTLGTISGIGLGGIGGNFRTVAYSPDGKTLAAGYGDGGDGGRGALRRPGRAAPTCATGGQGGLCHERGLRAGVGMIAAGMIAAGYGVRRRRRRRALFDARGERHRLRRWRSRRAHNQN